MPKLSFPWYDSFWLTSYVRVKQYLVEHHPARLADFELALAPLRTSPDFKLQLVAGLFDDTTRQQLRELAATLQLSELEKHELFNFGRFIVHDHPVLTSLQADLTDRMSEWTGEPVEPSYNFLSLYNNLGVCDPHLDAPSAKWTLDYCIAQSEPWPIHFSDIIDWPEAWLENSAADWKDVVKGNPAHKFTTRVLQENEALIFSGSSQWHYRDRIEQAHKQNFCHLAFFHYIPAGTRQLTQPENWVEFFGIPELASLVVREKAASAAATLPVSRLGKTA